MKEIDELDRPLRRQIDVSTPVAQVNGKRNGNAEATLRVNGEQDVYSFPPMPMPSSLDRAELVRLHRGFNSFLASARSFSLLLSEALKEPPAEASPTWLVLSIAAERYQLKPDTLRVWCRTVPGLGRRQGKLWWVSIPTLRQKLGFD